MNTHPYFDLCLSIQAVRRYSESLRTPLVTALGVGASIYPHQIANVLRVLTDVRVRHLLADEVGLGKTIQALMILNALRHQRKDLKVLIIVPDRLVPQWRDEIMTRAHTAPIGDKYAETQGNVEGKRFIRLAWQDQFNRKEADGTSAFSLADIDPDHYDMLVVDELHSLRADVQDRIVRVSNRFQHLLVLTATPAFQIAERHAQLFALLEPERTALVRRNIIKSSRGIQEGLSITDDISGWPKWALSELLHLFKHQEHGTLNQRNEQPLNDLSESHCVYRRVIRTRRVDYEGILPKRNHIPLVVKPLEAETSRQKLMWQYLNYLSSVEKDYDLVRLAKRVILSPPSLDQRLNELRREGHDREGLLGQVKTLAHKSQGDSRADALIDLLLQLWTSNPKERVLIAAQDNLTVDYLFDLLVTRLPEVGPVYDRLPLVVARIRQGVTTEAVTDLGGYGNETNENLEAFQNGEAQVLIAPDAGQVGLNLQCARVLVLYSVPWKPSEVEQWIGRLDRLGNESIFDDNGEPRMIDVYTIVQKGLIDEKVVSVLTRYKVFEHSVNLDADSLTTVESRIEEAALQTDTFSWNALESETEELALQEESDGLDSVLSSYLPWTNQKAKQIKERIENLSPLEPTLFPFIPSKHSGPLGWDRAFEGMLRLIRLGNEYKMRLNNDAETGYRFQSLWYLFGDRSSYGQRDVLSRIVFSFGADPGRERHPGNAFAFITRREDISKPPVRSVQMKIKGEDNASEVFRRFLHFVNFGNILHDELIAGWLEESCTNTMIEVDFPKGHPLHNHTGFYWLRTVVFDTAELLRVEMNRKQAGDAMVNVINKTKDDRLSVLIKESLKKLNNALEADTRWLRDHLTSFMQFEVYRRTHDGWYLEEKEMGRNLVDPFHKDLRRMPPSRALKLSEEHQLQLKTELDQLASKKSSIKPSHWGPTLPRFQNALSTRLAVIRAEANYETELLRSELEDAILAVKDAKNRGNRSQITRTENLKSEAEDLLQLTETFWKKREEWLIGTKNSLESLNGRTHTSALIYAKAP